jgi:hypothetical protein
MHRCNDNPRGRQSQSSLTSMIFLILSFEQICNIFQDHPKENLAMFWPLAIYGGTNLLKYYTFGLQVLKPIVKLYHLKNKNVK